MICGRIGLNPLRGQDDCLPMYVVRNPYCEKKRPKGQETDKGIELFSSRSDVSTYWELQSEPDNFSVALATATNIKRRL